MVREELLGEQQRRRELFEAERPDREMVIVLEDRVRAAVRTNEAAKARIREVELFRAQVKEALGNDAPRNDSQARVYAQEHGGACVGVDSPGAGRRAPVASPTNMPVAPSAGGVFGLRSRASFTPVLAKGRKA